MSSRPRHKSSHPLVSICLPTRNRAALLRLAIASLLKQTYTHIELILSDNASTDTTAQVCKEFQKKDKRVRYIRHATMIPAIDNFNAALSAAKGDYIMWAADDDLWDPSFLHEAMMIFEKDTSHSIALVSPMFAVMDQNGIIRSGQKRSFAQRREQTISFSDLLGEGFDGYKANLFFCVHRAETLRAIGGYKRLTPLAASDILSLYEIASRWKISRISKLLFYKREYYLSADTPRWTDRFSHLFMLFEIMRNIFIPDRLAFLFKRVAIYHEEVVHLIRIYHHGSIYLQVLAFFSAIQLFFHLAPNRAHLLRQREMAFLGKEAL